MKLIYASVFLNISLVLLFALIYWFCRSEFTKDITGKKFVIGDLIDYFYMSVTIQAGVGYQGLSPLTNVGKILLMLQQICMITSNIIVMYLIQLHFFNL
jgi:hypothetical protein